MRKIIIILLSMIFISGIMVSGLTFYPIYLQDKETGQPYLSDFVIKVDCPRDEWNQHFEDYRAGLIDKDSMKEYVKSCDW